HDRNEYDHGERGQRPAPRADVDADLPQLGDELAAVLRHPHIVPGETDDSDDEHARIQQLLAGAGKGVGNGAGKDRDDARAQHAGKDAEANPPGTPANAAGRGEHDANDEASLDDLAKDDDQSPKHGLFRDESSLGCVFVILAIELVAARIEWTDFDHRALPAGDHFLRVEILALEL